MEPYLEQNVIIITMVEIVWVAPVVVRKTMTTNFTTGLLEIFKVSTEKKS